MATTMQRPEIIKAITDSAFFHGVAYEERAALAEVVQVIQHGEGESLFQPRQLPTALYLVSEGVVEISRRQAPEGDLEPVAYRGPGAVLAESKVITGTPFNSLARFPEGGVTLQWPRPVILRRLFESRDLAMHYLQNLARRLEGTFANLGGHEATKLGGRLEAPTACSRCSTPAAGRSERSAPTTGASVRSAAARWPVQRPCSRSS
ncbi:MAG: hypothetical protein H6Q02_2669 [Acidobacteria bacterium]|nr:hypothetical protein [Acidobacteriota bacterium]